MSALVSLAVFSGLSMNLVLQCALGMRTAALEEAPSPPVFQMGIHFLSVLSLWTGFSCIAVPLGLEFLEYPALFPCSVLACSLLERLFSRLLPAAVSAPRYFGTETGYDGLIPAAAFIVLGLAASFVEALVLSLGFSLGVLFSFLLIQKIRLRSALEPAPSFLRGGPLTIISLGLLAMVYSSVAAVLFALLGAER